MKVKRIAFAGAALIGFLIALGTMAGAQESDIATRSAAIRAH
ncbi:MAG TPA: hypothetical protein VLR92_11530 [Blastocatellia bacterium]|nr:hypothetical protein [Blastocatellia bacterium]